MASLVTIESLATWCQQDIDDDDPFALKVVNGASLVVRETAQHPEWTLTGSTAAPERAVLIAELLAKRTYLNPDATISSSIGPLAETTVADFARTMELTAQERADLEGFWPGALPAGPGGLWVQPTFSREEPEHVFLGDISGSDWLIPFLDEESDPYYFPLLDQA